MSIDIEALERQVAEGLIRVQKHPTHDLYIYNYSKEVAYKNLWTPESLACRGLILDKDYNIVARPFQKFFNYGDPNTGPIPNEPFRVYEKMDGSLGIMYFIDNKPYIATRGSFISDQANHANEYLLPRDMGYPFNPEYTYLWEIVYKQNKIVVDYPWEGLMLLAIIRTSDGVELDIPYWEDTDLLMVKEYSGIRDFDEILNLYEENKEGYVVRFESGLRVKVKLAEYVRLHRLITGLSTKRLWESIRDNKSLEDFLADIPDELNSWVKRKSGELYAQYDAIEQLAVGEFKHDFLNRGAAAKYYKTCTYPHLMFKMYDGKEIHADIWKMIEPKGSDVYKEDDI